MLPLPLCPFLFFDFTFSAVFTRHGVKGQRPARTQQRECIGRQPVGWAAQRGRESRICPDGTARPAACLRVARMSTQAYARRWRPTQATAAAAGEGEGGSGPPAAPRVHASRSGRAPTAAHGPTYAAVAF